MEFNKENFQKFWKILNTAASKEERKIADEYLIAFKVIKILNLEK
jgi:hypothetical protein